MKGIRHTCEMFLIAFNFADKGCTQCLIVRGLVQGIWALCIFEQAVPRFSHRLSKVLVENQLRLINEPVEGQFGLNKQLVEHQLGHCHLTAK